ncbi:hypothetical protein, partial [Pandoraea sp.]|uniref:hypothetical protein n=1 Tax=Pandoraea sp. TaxID=1883445 RepID=UPI0035B316E3
FVFCVAASAAEKQDYVAASRRRQQFFRFSRSPPERLTNVKTTNHRAFQPVAPTASLLALRRRRCERRDISENPEPLQPLCENILKRGGARHQDRAFAPRASINAQRK